MCFAIPAQIVALKSETAVVATDEGHSIVGRSLVPDVRVGDWVLVNTGQVVNRITAEEAQAVRALLGEMMMASAQEEDEEGRETRAADSGARVLPFAAER